MKFPHQVFLVRTALAAAAAGLTLGALAAPSMRPKTVLVEDRGSEAGQVELIEVANASRQWTGVAVSQDGRLFVNYPLWGDKVEFAVGEVIAGPGLPQPGVIDAPREGEPPATEVVAYPNEAWNASDESVPPADRFVCVQSVHVGRDGRLWILDPANPRFEGVVEGGPKLLAIDLETDEVVRKYPFDAALAPKDSYLNDVRVDAAGEWAYLTDSGASALLVVNIETGEIRRLLDDHPSTQSETLPVNIDGKTWTREGKLPDIHADGIALSADERFLYYHALTARGLYRVPTAALRDASLSAEDLGAQVEKLTETGPLDGMLFGRDGRVYLTDLEGSAIQAFDPATGGVEMVAQNPLLSWPDSLAQGLDGSIYVTTSQIHHGQNPPEPYRVLKFRP